MKTEITMKKILISLIGMMGLLGLVGCEKDHVGPETNQDRDIFYTVGGAAGLSGFSGTTAHLATEAEWDALLDRFCDYAQNGEQVMFCSTQHQTGSDYSVGKKGNTSDAPTSISTSDREELKAWMKVMEKDGKTVRVTYENGTWHGTAYANLGQDNMQEPQLYTGTLAFVPTPVLENPPLGGTVWAMQLNDGRSLILTLHGMMMWNDSDNPDENILMLEGAEISLEGVLGSHSDMNGNAFLTLGLYVEEN